MKNILFSIIIPTYNCENLIKSTLDSIVCQNKDLYECIIMDGISKDRTVDIVKNYAHIYPNIRYVSQRDNGVYDAMNKAIDLAEGEYLYFIGAGDRLYDDALGKVSKFTGEADFILGRSYHVSKKQMFYFPKKKSDVIYYHLNHQAIFYKKHIFDCLGKYDNRYYIFADNILNKRIFGRDDIVKKLIDVNIAYYLGDGISEKVDANDGFYDDFEQIILECFGREYLKSLYKYINLETRRLIAWGNSGEYIKANKYKPFEFDYFVKSKANVNETFEGKAVKARNELLSEDKDKIFILVYSATFYNEIREWLEENGFKEFENFMLATESVFKVLDYI